jgi:hypothetical protein
MGKSRAAGWVSDSPTPAQLKELFAQIDSGRITKERLQIFLRGEEGNWFWFTTSGLSLRELRDRNPDFFYPDPWWEKQPFSERRGKRQEILLRMSFSPDSFGKTWDEQNSLLDVGEFVPTTADVVEGMFAYYRMTGERLFPNYRVRTSDVSSSGNRAIVCFGPNDHISVFYYWQDHRGYASLGLAVARLPA